MPNVRVEKILSKMKDQNISQMIVSDPPSIFYLLNKWIHPGERMLALLLDGEGGHKLFINELFPVYEYLGVDKVWFKDTDKPISLVAQYVREGVTIGIDKNWPSRFLLELMGVKSNCNYVNGSPIIDEIRASKDEYEKGLMREASSLNDTAMKRVVDLISPELTEKQVVQKLLNIFEELGAEGPSFKPIIAFGANGADPHHGTDSSTLKEGDSIIIDIGCRFNSYCSDMTRTIFYKSASKKAKEVYNVVKEANERAISIVKPGVRFCDIDAAARNYIEEKGYGKYFTHRTGHSIGIEVHDFGDVSSVNTETVAPGMIFSIEPGIYLPREFGVRIEDLVLVTEDGCEVLNKFPKDLMIIG